MISLKALWDAFQKHTHTLTSLGAAAANHTHTAEAIGAADRNHTHSAASLGLGMQLAGHGKGDRSMVIDIAGKSMGILYIAIDGDWYPAVFAVGSIGLGINIVGIASGEYGYNDYEVRVSVAINGTKATLFVSSSGSGLRSGLGACYLM